MKLKILQIFLGIALVAFTCSPIVNQGHATTYYNSIISDQIFWQTWVTTYDPNQRKADLSLYVNKTFIIDAITKAQRFKNKDKHDFSYFLGSEGLGFNPGEYFISGSKMGAFLDNTISFSNSTDVSRNWERNNVPKHRTLPAQTFGEGYFTEFITKTQLIANIFKISDIIVPEKRRPNLSALIDEKAGIESLGAVENVSVPEPGTVFLLGAGLVGLVGLSRKKTIR